MVTRYPEPKGNPPLGRQTSPDRGQSGFTMVEVIVAIMILAVGLLGMAGTTAVVVRQITLADVTSERAAALQTTIERLYALPFDSVVNGSDSVGVFGVEWNVRRPALQWAAVEIITTGPGMKTADGGFPSLNNSVADTFTYRILR